MRKSIGLSVFGGAIFFVGAACSNHGTSPIAPTPSAIATSAPSGTGATISGVVSTGASSVARTGWRALDVSHVTVSVAGTSVSGVADSGGNFTLNGVPPIQVVLNFVGPGIDAALPLGTVTADEHLQIGVTLSNTTATLDTQQRTGSDQAAEAEGWIETIDAGLRQIVLSGTLVRIPPEATIRRGAGLIGFSNLNVGDRAHVRGIKDGTLIRASEVIAQSDTPTPADVVVSMKGVITGITGVCPSLSLSVGGTKVVTNASTTFGVKSCGVIVSGDIAGVVGSKRNDGIVLAAKVDVAESSPPPAPAPVTVTFTGTLAAFGGTCPSLSLKVSDTYVRTSGATAFSGKSCADLKVGDTVAVAGTRQTDNTVVATTLQVSASAPPPPPPPPPPPVIVTFTGTLTAFGGTCPSLTLKVSDTYVRTNAGTAFSGKSCSDLKVGDVAGVVGTKQSDTTVLATSFQVSK